MIIGRLKEPGEYKSKDGEDKMTYVLHVEEMYFLGDQGWKSEGYSEDKRQQEKIELRHSMKPQQKTQPSFDDDLPY